jgi:hypothetical protein
MISATVSGSFHRHMPAIYGAVQELRAVGVDVLSPSDPRIVDHLGEFLFVASDKLRSVKLVQDRHFEAIRRSNFLWIVCPDGYTGPSTSAEIGAAYAFGVPVFSDHLPLDVTLQHYVRKVTSLQVVVENKVDPHPPCAYLIRRAVFAEPGVIYSPPTKSRYKTQDDFAKTGFLDADLIQPNKPRISLRKTIADSFVYPIAKTVDLVDRGFSLGSATPMSAILFGPPGTSKTQLAKLISDYLGWPLLSVDPFHASSAG